MKAYVVIGALGGILSSVEVTLAQKTALETQKRFDDELGINRDSEGCYQSDNDCWLEEVEIQEDLAGLFLARFTQRDGEYEYDQLAFIRARDEEAAEKVCIEEMKKWWTGNEDEPSMQQDEDNYLCFEEIGVGRVVELDSVRRIKSFQEAIDAVGVIHAPEEVRKVYLQLRKSHGEEGYVTSKVALSDEEKEQYLEDADPGENITLLEADVVLRTMNSSPSCPFDK